MEKCLKCGATVKPGERFCGECGTEIKETKEVKKPETTKKDLVAKETQEKNTSKVRKSFNLSLGKIIGLAVILVIAFVCALFKDDISYKISDMKQEKEAEEKIAAANIEGKWYDGTYDVGDDIDEGRYHIIGLEDFSTIHIFASEEDYKKYEDDYDDKHVISEEYLDKGEEVSVKLEDGDFVKIDGCFGYEDAK